MNDNDPLQLCDKPPAQAVRAAQVAPTAQIEHLFQRLNSTVHADSTEVRMLLLAHLIFAIYMDIKETFAE